MDEPMIAHLPQLFLVEPNHLLFAHMDVRFDGTTTLRHFTVDVNDVVVEEGDLSPEERGYVDQIHRNAERVRGIMKQILMFVGRMTPGKYAVEVDRLMSETEKLLHHTLPKNIEVETSFARDLRPVQGDETQLSQVLMNLSTHNPRPAATILAVNAVQEEIGGSGVKMISYRLEPNVAIVLDVTHATDSPGIDRNKHGSTKLGAGPAVTHGTANHPLVVNRLISIAKKLSISLQHEASSRTTGTDTDHVYPMKGGVPSALLSVPLRYMHSTVEMIDFSDVEQCILLLTNFVLSVSGKDEFAQKLR